MAKLDDTGKHWVTSLAKYNFHLHYKSGKQNVEADSLSYIPWDHDEETQIDNVIVKPLWMQ